MLLAQRGPLPIYRRGEKTFRTFEHAERVLLPINRLLCSHLGVYILLQLCKNNCPISKFPTVPSCRIWHYLEVAFGTLLKSLCSVIGSTVPNLMVSVVGPARHARLAQHGMAGWPSTAWPAVQRFGENDMNIEHLGLLSDFSSDSLLAL